MTLRFRIYKTHEDGIRPGDENGQRCNLYIRLRDGVAVDQTARTSLLVNPDWWDQDKEIVSAFSPCPEDEANTINSCIVRLRRTIATRYVCDSAETIIHRDWLYNTIVEIEHLARRPGLGEDYLLDVFNEFTAICRVSEVRRSQFLALGKILERFERYSASGARSKKLRLHSIDARALDRLWIYMKNEHAIIKATPHLFEGVVPERPIKKRCDNTINDLFKKLRVFFSWCVDNDYIQASPFRRFHMRGERYGTPVFLTKEEVLGLYAFDFGSSRALEKQRDIFVFQCNVGCRVGDMMRMHKSDVRDGTLYYIPHKTVDKRPETISVPLNSTARAIVEKYASLPGDSLLPFVSVQKYNETLKTVFERAGLTRCVTIPDQLEGSEKQVQLCEIASSHMARRTFAGNLYRQVKDPSLIGSMTGHSEGSRAFARYRAIDDSMKHELVELLE